MGITVLIRNKARSCASSIATTSVKVGTKPALVRRPTNSRLSVAIICSRACSAARKTWSAVITSPCLLTKNPEPWILAGRLTSDVGVFGSAAGSSATTPMPTTAPDTDWDTSIPDCANDDAETQIRSVAMVNGRLRSARVRDTISIYDGAQIPTPLQENDWERKKGQARTLLARKI